MTENRLYHSVVVPTLVPKREMWSLSEERVRSTLLMQLPIMHRIANNWHSSRPTMRRSFSGQGPSSQTYKRDVLSRQTDRVRYATEESHELLKAVRTCQNPDEVKLELGDTLFWLLLLDQSFNPDKRVHIYIPRFEGDIPKVELGSEIFKHEISSYDKDTMKLFGGEEAVVLAVGMLGRQLANDSHRHIGRERIYAYLDFAIATLSRYALSQNWDLSEIIAKVAEKNDRNYPKDLFDRMSPFAYDVDAIDFLNLLKRLGNKRSSFADLIDDLFPEIKTRSYLPNQLSKELVISYRATISKLLDKVIETSNDVFSQLVAEYLLRVGQWDDKLL